MNIFLLGIVLILAAASLSLQKSVSALIAFALMMLTLGIYYFVLDEQLLGVFQIFIYTGGISVLMLFGMTLIGTDAPKSKNRAWAALGAFVVFVLLIIFFWRYIHLLPAKSAFKPENSIFSKGYGDFVLIFALMGTSVLYATVKAAKLLQRKKDV
jgi:NADH-quinone oxidoreductase subunit J